MLTCISDMVIGLGAPFHQRVLELLDLLLQSGLTSELIETLSVIATHLPTQRSVVQRRLMQEVTKILGWDPNRSTGRNNINQSNSNAWSSKRLFGSMPPNRIPMAAEHTLVLSGSPVRCWTRPHGAKGYYLSVPPRPVTLNIF